MRGHGQYDGQIIVEPSKSEVRVAILFEHEVTHGGLHEPVRLLVTSVDCAKQLPAVAANALGVGRAHELIRRRPPPKGRAVGIGLLAQRFRGNARLAKQALKNPASLDRKHPQVELSHWTTSSQRRRARARAQAARPQGREPEASSAQWAQPGSSSGPAL